MIDPKIVGQYIKKKRETNQLTQNQLAESLGVEPQTISKWERGNGLPDISSIKHLARLFETSIEHLISGGTSDEGFSSLVERIAFHDDYSLFSHYNINYKTHNEAGKTILDYCLIHESINLVETLKSIDPGFIISSPRYQEIRAFLLTKGKNNLLLQLEEIEKKLVINYCPFCGSPLEGPKSYKCDICHKEVHVESDAEIIKRERKHKIIRIASPIFVLTLLSNILYTTYYLKTIHEFQLSQKLEMIHLYSDTIRHGIDDTMGVLDAIGDAWQDQLENDTYDTVYEAIELTIAQNQRTIYHISEINDILSGLAIRFTDDLSSLHPDLYVLSQAIQIRYHLLFESMYTASTTSLEQYLYLVDTEEHQLTLDLDHFDTLLEDIVL